MRKKRIVFIILLLLIICIILFLGKKEKSKENTTVTEIIPEEEISEEQERETMVVLYFKNTENEELVKETRVIDVKKLTNNPYQILIEMLIEGPKNEKLQTTIPQGTKINNVYLKENIVYIDFSKEFIDNHKGGKEEEKTINSIVNTLTELTEVKYVKILIDGKENMKFKDGNVNFSEKFERKN